MTFALVFILTLAGSPLTTEFDVDSNLTLEDCHAARMALPIPELAYCRAEPRQ